MRDPLDRPTVSIPDDIGQKALENPVGSAFVAVVVSGLWHIPFSVEIDGA
jgi:hypothetical protein